MKPAPTRPTGEPGRLRRSWYTTAAVAAAVAVLAVLGSERQPAFRLAALPLAVVALTAVIEGTRRPHRLRASSPVIWLTATSLVAAAVLCLIALADPRR